MGTWGYKNFENDTAADWYVALVENPNKESVLLYLRRVLEEDEFIDDEESFISLAILETINGKLNLMKSEFYFPDIENLSTIKVAEMSMNAGKKILFSEHHSELRELWSEEDDYSQWFNYQFTLIKNLEILFKEYRYPRTVYCEDNVERAYEKYFNEHLD